MQSATAKDSFYNKIVKLRLSKKVSKSWLFLI